MPSSAQSEVGYGTGDPAPVNYGVWGSVAEFPQRGPGIALAINTFWRIWKAIKCSFCTYMLKYLGSKAEVWRPIANYSLPQRRTAPVCCPQKNKFSLTTCSY